MSKMEAFIVYEAKSGKLLGRILAREGEQFEQAVLCWPKMKDHALRIEHVDVKQKTQRKKS